MMTQKEIGSTIFTSLSGMVGGSAVMIASENNNAFSYTHLLEVMLYAAVSALIGYVVKLLVDGIRKSIKKRFAKKQQNINRPCSKTTPTNE